VSGKREKEHMALLIEFEDVERAGLIRWEEVIETTENVVRDIGKYGEQINHPRRRLHCPTWTRVSIHAGAAMPFRLLGMMIHSELPVVVEDGTPLPHQVVKGRGDYVYVLYEADTAKLAAIIRRRRDQTGVDYRTAATSIVGTKLLMRPNSHSVAIFGSSHQARSHLEALARVMELRRVRLFSPNAEHRRAFCAEMSHKLSLEVEPVDRPQLAMQEADVVLEASNTAVPVFEGKLLEPGMHVTTIAGSNRELANQQGVVRRPVDQETLRRSDLVFVILKEQMRQDEQGGIFDEIKAGRLTWDKVYEIGDLLAGNVQGRTDPSQITFYNNNAGMGAADVTLAALVYKAARENSLGKEI
jgi:ornithine cyclodeaminase/alanine dehydrogenase-like protein (mu-crystallin family)